MKATRTNLSSSKKLIGFVERLFAALAFGAVGLGSHSLPVKLAAVLPTVAQTEFLKKFFLRKRRDTVTVMVPAY